MNSFLKKIAKTINEAKQFGISDDGWDKEDLNSLIAWCDDVYQMAYDIKNARRGSYDRELGDNMESLIERLESIEHSLSELIDDYKSLATVGSNEDEQEELEESNKTKECNKDEDSKAADYIKKTIG